ncbi:hypothetical protein LCGC14_0967150 [marine sediment metagenome]|uniref:Uncharacterized protein n=1 Tax=marine sediment metagenome TaxID=412755 RepID=A0A0F9QW25_9ZZZZ
MQDQSIPEKQPESQGKLLHRKQYVTTTPLIYEWQLRALCYSEMDGEFGSYRVLSPFESFVYGITGPRGAGKDESLTLLAMIYLANGQPVWLNYPMKYYLKREGAEEAELLEAQPLDMDKWLNHSEEYEGGFIGISEFQDWDNSFRQMGNQSLIIHSWIDQIRKLECSFGYTAKRLEDVGGKTVSETDMNICCMDVTDSIELQDGVPHGDGAMVKWFPLIDMSGKLTKRMGAWLPPKLQPMYALWGSYNSAQKFDFFEAMRGVKFDFTKRVIGDGNGHADIDLEEMKNRTLEILQSQPNIQAGDLWETLGVKNPQHMRQIGNLLENTPGITVKHPKNKKTFLFGVG